MTIQLLLQWRHSWDRIGSLLETIALIKGEMDFKIMKEKLITDWTEKQKEERRGFSLLCEALCSASLLEP